MNGEQLAAEYNFSIYKARTVMGPHFSGWHLEPRGFFLNPDQCTLSLLYIYTYQARGMTYTNTTAQAVQENASIELRVQSVLDHQFHVNRSVY